MDAGENSSNCDISCGCPSIAATRASLIGCSRDPLVTSCEKPFPRCINSFRGNNCISQRAAFSMALFRRMTAVLSAVLVAIALTMVPSAVAFNVAVERALVIKGANDSMFGYAVAQHVDQSMNWLLIGAPLAQTSQSRVARGGAVFRCRTDSANACHEIPFDHTDQKSGQWFGSTVKSAGENGVIVACAPRYQDKHITVGVCYVAKANITKYAPCATDKDSLPPEQELYGPQGHCQAGLSAVFSNGGKRLLIGAPGYRYWQGRMFQYDAISGVKYKETREGEKENDNDYMGYSSATGEFDGDNSDDYVVGIPKGDYYLGKVELFTQNLTVLGSLTGEQIGAYFGFSLAVADLNGDRMDDIIVGAPMYAELESDAYDTGRVYIYYQISNYRFRRNFSARTRDTLDGKSSSSRFGMALSSLGDINYDGYKDLCVGAPYAGEDKRGAIYIFHGSKKGIITEVSQIIYAKEIETPLSAFGISISGGLDQDGNSYPDILVGAYTSDKAVFLRSKPVVRVIASLRVQPEMINLDSESCSLADNTRVPCFTVYTCINITGVGVPDELALDITLVLDANNNKKKQEQRAFYRNSDSKFTETKTHILQKSNYSCTTAYAYVKKDPNDKLSPIRVTMDFKLNEEALKRHVLPPILDAYIPTTTSFTAHILKDCGKDNICIPDLAVTPVRAPIEHKIGSTAPLEVMLIVFNRGEDSFNTNLWIDLPPGVTYKTISNQRSNVTISCGTLKNDNTKVVCGLGNPMQKSSESEFTLVLTPTNAKNTQNSLVFTLFANSTNQEKAEDYANNNSTFEIPVTIPEPDIVLYGVVSLPELVVLNTTEEKGEDKGQNVTHVFQLHNQQKGLSAANETLLQIKWPTYDKQGNPVLVIEKELIIQGNGVCKIIILTPNNVSDYVNLGSLTTLAELSYDGVRKKRDTSSNTIACSDRYCTIIECHVGYLAPSDSFVLTVESRLMVRSFIQKQEPTEMYNITVVAFAKVLSVPYDLMSVDASTFGLQRKEVITTINTELQRSASKGVAIWVIILAVIGGLLALLLLILLLWRCGFFKRKKPMEEGYSLIHGKTVDNTVTE